MRHDLKNHLHCIASFIELEQYQDADQVEFITNPDGTISVLIKNINKITTR